MKRLLFIVALLLLLPASAHAWWSKDWTVRKQITLDTQAAGVTADLVSVPVLIRLSSGNFNFLSAKEDGSDIRFVAQDDVTPLKLHLERFDKVNELAFFWVMVPKLAASNSSQHIWIYSGNEKAASVSDSKTSYDAATLMAYQFSDGKELPLDTTANSNNIKQGKLTWVTAGLIGGSAKLAGDGGLVTESPALLAAKEFTFSAWIKPEKADGELLASAGLTLSLTGGIPVLALNNTQARATAPITMGAWHHIAVVVGQGNAVYVDGKLAVPGTGASNGAFSPTANIRIGSGLVGDIDEVQISNVARSAAWVATQFESQAQAGKLVKYGEDKSSGSEGGESYFTTTMKNVTVDGWVVVIICALMFVVAIWVMISKTLFLNRVEKANRMFSEEFGKMSRGLAELDDNVGAHAGKMDHLAKMLEEFKHSSLYRIYHVGVTELKHRFPSADSNQAMPVISERSFNAVRASLDAQLTREGQRMNKAMVLLTIAISGGPFLGLLGTVVGVMITFAAIAAAGDVNVNAIAPGIAAALVATVAGLGVAIPALFGYNYLMTKIKEISADMNVFVDEFVTKMAENYGG